jgi:hypothetical protein
VGEVEANAGVERCSCQHRAELDRQRPRRCDQGDQDPVRILGAGRVVPGPAAQFATGGLPSSTTGDDQPIAAATRPSEEAWRYGGVDAPLTSEVATVNPRRSIVRSMGRHAPLSRPWRWLVGSASAAFLLLAGCTASTSAPGTAPATAPGAPVRDAAVGQMIPLSIVTVAGAPRLVADIHVGGTPLRVLLDTGSSGLRVVASKLSPGSATPVGPAPAYAYGSGVELTGTDARASVGIGAVHSVAPLPIELVEATHCVAAQPRCPAADGHAPPAFGGVVDGILGVSLRASTDLGDPMSGLPGGQAFAVHYDPAGHSSLLLGAPADGFTLQRLQPAPAGGPADAAASPNWVAALPLCFRAPSKLAEPACTNLALFDTGSASTTIIAAHVTDATLPPNTTLTLATTDNRWSQTYITGPGQVATLISPTHAGTNRSIVGLPAFARVDLRFDRTAGTIGFRSR